MFYTQASTLFHEDVLQYPAKLQTVHTVRGRELDVYSVNGET